MPVSEEEEQGQIALEHLLDFPGGDAGEQADERGEQDQRERQAVDADFVLDVERGDPGRHCWTICTMPGR